MPDLRPIITTPTCSAALIGRTPATGDPRPPEFLRLKMRLRVQAAEWTWLVLAGVGDIPVWVVIDGGTQASRYFYRVELDEDIGQVALFRGWFSSDVDVSMPVGFRPSAQPITIAILHGEWQTGVKGSIGRDVSEASARAEYAKGTRSELFLGASAPFVIPDDRPGSGDLYGDPRGTLERGLDNVTSVLKLAALVGGAAWVTSILRGRQTVVVTAPPRARSPRTP